MVMKDGDWDFLAVFTVAYIRRYNQTAYSVYLDNNRKRALCREQEERQEDVEADIFNYFLILGQAT